MVNSNIYFHQVSAEARVGGSYQVNGVNYQIYDISASNTGSEAILSLFGFFGYPSGNSIDQAWNYDGSSGEISGFGGSLAAGQVSFLIFFIVQNFKVKNIVILFYFEIGEYFFDF